MHPDSPAKPADFAEYWAEVDTELAGLPIAAEEELLELRSTEYCTTYKVHYTGLDGYRLMAYLSIPKGEGPFPVFLNISNYTSVLQILPQGDAVEKRRRYITFTPGGRGQRNVDKPYRAEFPGFFLDGIDDPSTYIFRAHIADLLRGVDYLLTRPEVDTDRIAAVTKFDLSVFIAALRPAVTHLVAKPVFFYDTVNNASNKTDYPLEEINDYLRSFPEKEAGVRNTLSYFDIRHFAPMIKIPTLLWGNVKMNAPLIDALGGVVETRDTENSFYKDGVFQEKWIARQHGFDGPILPENW